MNRILILLNETRSPLTARKLALTLSQESGAILAGLAGIDVKYIQAPIAGRAGTISYQVHLQSTLRKQAEEERERLKQAFTQDCSSAGVKMEWVAFEGDPIESIGLVSESSDLMMSGHDTSFQGNAKPVLSDTVRKLVSKLPRPIIVCPDGDVQDGDILVVHDGTAACSRAIQSFALLRLKIKARCQVLSVDPDEALAAQRAMRIKDYLEGVGYGVAAVSDISEGHAVRQINKKLSQSPFSMLVTGMTDRHNLIDRLFGATVDNLLINPPTQLFIGG